MTTFIAMGLFCRVRRAACPLLLCCVFLLGVGASAARAGFIEYYAPSNFTFTQRNTVTGDDYPGGNGDYIFPDLFTLVLTGTNDGSGTHAYTELMIPAGGTGLFQFHYMFQTLDLPGFQYAGYVIGNVFTLLADEDGISDPVSVPVNAGDLIGFRVGGDGQGGTPGILTITEFSAPVPEPGTLQLLLIAGGALLAGKFYRRRVQRPRS